MKRLLIAAALAASMPAQAQVFSANVVARGRYLATAADCTACHSMPGSKTPYAGGYAISSPLGAIYATNITPSKSHGIGKYSEAQFAAALRQGIRADGARLYPAMPYTSYTGLRDADVHALYAYFMQGVAPVDRAARRTVLPFPFNLRISMAFWNALFLKDARFVPDRKLSAQENRGAYLAGALEHCSACHSPRGFLMQEQTGKALSGGPLGAWFAPNITPHAVAGIGGWSQAEIVTYLKTGRVTGKAQAAGGMAEAVTNSLQHLSNDDLAAIAAFLKTVPPISEPKATRAAYTYGAPLHAEAAQRGTNRSDRPDGAALFSGLCASCHTASGAGTQDHAFPSLFNNSTVGAARSDNLVAVILGGVDRTVDGQHSFMPGFGAGSYVQSLSDDQIAALATYVRANFGPGGHVSASEVATARAGGPASPLLKLAPFSMAAVIALVLASLGYLFIRRRKKVAR
jgi:mono/diheme cytochrome c family protein